MQININLKIQSAQNESFQLTEYQFSKPRQTKSNSTTKSSLRYPQTSNHKQQHISKGKNDANKFFQEPAKYQNLIQDPQQVYSQKQLHLFDLKNLNILQTREKEKAANVRNKSSLKSLLFSKFSNLKNDSFVNFPFSKQSQDCQFYVSKDIKIDKKASQIKKTAKVKKTQDNRDNRDNRSNQKSKKSSRSKNKNKIKYTENKPSKLNFNFNTHVKQSKGLSTNYNSKFSAKKSTNLFQDQSEGNIKKMGKSFIFECVNPSKSLNFQDQKHCGSLPGISGKKVLQRYAPLLSQNQKDQLVNQKTVYYIGVGVTSGQDNQQGSYIWRKHEQIGYRYQLIQALGKGAFGEVIKSFDHKTKQFVALKIIRAKKQNMELAMNEINILMKMKQNDIQNEKNIVKIKDFIVFRKHICIVTQLLSVSLYELIEANQFKPLQLQYIRTFAIQILNAMSFLKENKIIHSDIKPQNILLKSKLKTGLKLIDFGTSMFINQAHYLYIQSRFYRSPEVILGGPYDYAIDMWSFGCLLVELYLGRPLFPGRSQAQQIALIVQTLGLPQIKFLKGCKNYQKYFHKNGALKANEYSDKTIPNVRRLSSIINTDKQFLDFIQKILKIQPKQRLNPYQALLDPWIVNGLPESIREDHKKYIWTKLQDRLENLSFKQFDCMQVAPKIREKQQDKLSGSKHRKRNSDFSKNNLYKHNRRRSDGCKP